MTATRDASGWSDFATLELDLIVQHVPRLFYHTAYTEEEVINAVHKMVFQSF